MFPEKFLLQNIVRTTAVALLTGEGTFKKTSANKVLSIDDTSTKRHNELYSEVWKRFSQSSTDVPALPPHAMLPRQARGTLKKYTKPAAQFILSLSISISKVGTHCGLIE